MSHIDAVVRDCFETVSALILLPCLQMAFAHDSVRVLQCFLQFGSHEQRQLVFEELKGKQAAFAASSTTTFVWCLGNSRKTSSAVPTDDVVTLSKSQYGRHVVKKLLMYGCVHSDFPLLMVWKEECFQNFSQQLRFRLSLSLEFGIFFHVVFHPQQQRACRCCHAVFQRSRTPNASPRRGLLHHWVRLQRQSCARTETHAHWGALWQHICCLQGSWEFIFQNQTQRHLRLLWNSLGCGYSTNILVGWLHISLLLVDCVQHHRESHRGQPR